MVERGGGHVEPPASGKRERGVQPASSVVFHERAKAAGAYNKVPERRRPLMEAYLTTSATYKELRPLVGDVTVEAVRQQIWRGLLELRRGLPAEMREELDTDKLNRPKRPKQPRRQEG